MPFIALIPGRKIIWLFAACSLLILVRAETPASTMTELIAVSKGDMAAIQLNLYAPVCWRVSCEQYDVQIFAMFDRSKAKLVMDLYGLKDNVADAQAVISSFLNLLITDYIPFFKSATGIEIQKLTDLRIQYRNRAEEGRKIIIIWEEGKFKYPLN
jgi:hypothetical protein